MKSAKAKLLKKDNEQKAKEAKLLEKSWETFLIVDGEYTTLYAFLEENYNADSDQITGDDIEKLFKLEVGDEMFIHVTKIKRIK